MHDGACAGGGNGRPFGGPIVLPIASDPGGWWAPISSLRKVETSISKKRAASQE
jgi:hypothetical protein